MLESLRDIDGQRSGRSLDSVDKTIYDFCTDSKFDVRKTRIIEWFSFECRKSKTKEITIANHNKRKEENEPTRTRSKYT